MKRKLITLVGVALLLFSAVTIYTTLNSPPITDDSFPGLSPASLDVIGDKFLGYFFSGLLICMAFFVIGSGVVPALQERRNWGGIFLFFSISALILAVFIFGVPFGNNSFIPKGIIPSINGVKAADYQDWIASAKTDSALCQLESDLRTILGEQSWHDIELGAKPYLSSYSTEISGFAVSHVELIRTEKVQGSTEGWLRVGGLLPQERRVVLRNDGFAMPVVTGGESILMIGEHEGKPIRLIIPGREWLKAQLWALKKRYHPEELRSVETFQNNMVYGRHWDTVVTLIAEVFNSATGREDDIIHLFRDPRNLNSLPKVSWSATPINEGVYFVDAATIISANHIPDGTPRYQTFLGYLTGSMLQNLSEEAMKIDSKVEPMIGGK
jgi:hypothetical protein